MTARTSTPSSRAPSHIFRCRASRSTARSRPSTSAGAAPSSASSSASRRAIPTRSHGPRSRSRSSCTPSTCSARWASTHARLPLERRKELLAGFVPRTGFVRFTDHLEGDGERLFELAAAHALEGVIAKRADSRYQSGRRTRDWLKLKAPRAARSRGRRMDPGPGVARALGALLRRRAPRRRVALRRQRRLRPRRSDDRRAAAACSRRSRTAKPPCAGVPEPPPRGARWVAARARLRGALYGASRARDCCASRSSCGSCRRRAPRNVRRSRRRRRGARRSRVLRRGSGRAAALPRAGAPPAPSRSSRASTRSSGPATATPRATSSPTTKRSGRWLAPYLRDRPVVLTRYPDGIDGKSFFQKNAPDFTPDWVPRLRIDDTDYFVCNDLRDAALRHQLRLRFRCTSGARARRRSSDRTG